MKTAPGTDVSALPVLTPAAAESLAKPGPIITRPDEEAAKAARPRPSSPSGLPVLTDPAAEAASRPAPKPSSPALPSPAAAPEQASASPKFSMYEQLEALERAEQAQAAASAGAPPRLDAQADDAPVVVGARLHTLEPSLPAAPAAAQVDAMAVPEEEPLELDTSSWKGESPSGAARARVRPSAPLWRPASSAPRPYVPLTVALAAPPPPRRLSLVLGVVALAAVGVGVTLAVLSAQGEGLALPGDPEPQVAPAVVSRPTAPAPPPPVEEGKLRFKGVPRGAKVTVDGALVADPAGESVYPRGTHQVLVELKGYAKFEASVDVAAGETKLVAVAMKKVRKKR